MSTPQFSAGSVMDKAAALLNDNAKQIYTYEVQLPYLNIALQDLRKELQLNNSPVTNKTNGTPIEIPAGTIEVPFNAPSGPKLPVDLIEIQQLWESNDGNYFTPMTKVEFLPHYLEGSVINQLLMWEWSGNSIKFLPASADNFIKIDYIRNLFPALNHSNDNIGVINADSYLQFRTASLLAQFVAENPTRAAALNTEVIMARDNLLGIDNKGKQAIATRRRPFRARWKQRGWW